MTRELKLFVLAPEWGLPSITPFGTKLATWIRMAGIDHELVYENDPRKGPKGKSPWIVDDGVAIGDSELVIEHLRATRGVDPDAQLSDNDRAIGLLLRRTFEEHFHQILEYSLFQIEDGWQALRPHFEFLPAVIRPLVRSLIRRQVRASGHARGVPRHTHDEIAGMSAADFDAAAQILGDREFVFGDQPTTTDCTLFGFFSVTLWAPIPYFAQEQLAGHANLVAYTERMLERFWPELAPELLTRSSRPGPTRARAAS